MRKIIICLFYALAVTFVFSFSALAGNPKIVGKNFNFSWSRTKIDGSMTGVTASSSENVSEALGVIDNERYVSPNGKVFGKNTSVYAVAKVLLESQGIMAGVKKRIGYAPKAMVREYPECELSNWFIDELMAACEKKSGKKVDFGITNFGGIRVDMPQGDVLVDNIMSMFPFKNNLCYVELYGRDIRALLEQLSATSFQVIGGARVVVQDGKLVSAEIGGKPIEDDKIYGVCTISFLLNGGDGISVAKNAVSLTVFDEYILDIMLPYVERLTAEGKSIEYHKDGRVVILGANDESVRM